MYVKGRPKALMSLSSTGSKVKQQRVILLVRPPYVLVRPLWLPVVLIRRLHSGRSVRLLLLLLRRIAHLRWAHRLLYMLKSRKSALLLTLNEFDMSY